MKGRGIPSIRSKVRGDQYVTVNVEVPRNLNSKQKELLREFEEDKNYKQKKSFAEKMKDYCNKNNIELGFIQAGKPTQNSLIERFNRTFRTEFLNVYIFENVKQMRNYAEIWMWMYNNERPHSALQYLTPRDFLLKYGKLNQNNANEFPTFQQNFNNDNNKILTKNSTFDCA